MTQEIKNVNAQSLCDAIERNDVAAVQRIITTNNVNAQCRSDTNRSELHHAVSLRHATIATMLIDIGADVNAVAINEKTPLHYTAELNNGGACVSALLAAGAYVNAVSYSWIHSSIQRYQAQRWRRVRARSTRRRR